MREKCPPRAAGGGRARGTSPQRSPPGAPGGTSAVLQAPFPGTLLTSGRSSVPARQPRILPRDPRVLPRDSRYPPAASPTPGGCLLQRASGPAGSDGQTASVPEALKTVRNLGSQSPGRCHRGEWRLEDPLAPSHPVGGLALQCWSVPGVLVERAALSVLPRIAKRCPRVEKGSRGIAAKTKVTCRVILLSLWEVLRKAELPFTAHH